MPELMTEEKAVETPVVVKKTSPINAVLLLTTVALGTMQTYDTMTEEQQQETTIKTHMRIMDSIVDAQALKSASSFHYVYGERDSITPEKDTIKIPVQAFQVAEVDFKPHVMKSDGSRGNPIYTRADQVFEVLVRDTITDSAWFKGFVQSDSVGLLHVVARIQPSKPPSAVPVPGPVETRPEETDEEGAITFIDSGK